MEDFTISLDCPKCGYIKVNYPFYYKKFTLSCECGNKVIDDFTDIYKKYDNLVYLSKES